MIKQMLSFYNDRNVYNHILSGLEIFIPHEKARGNDSRYTRIYSLTFQTLQSPMFFLVSKVFMWDIY